jgi:predicted RNA-binding Zn-ribbon protein involved in translation (DUF1610 family)
MSRKIKRNQEKKAKKQMENEVKQKINMFGKISEECLSCEKPFNKQEKEMVSSWYVVVREEKVNLYCPNCWTTAQRIIKEFQDGQDNAKNNV